MAFRLRLPWTTRARDAAPSSTALVASNDNSTGIGDGVTRSSSDGLISSLGPFGAGLGGPFDRTARSFYAPYIPRDWLQWSSMYTGAWLPRRIVDCRTEDMTREWVTPTWKGHDTDADGPRAIEAEETRLNVRGNVTEGVRWGGLFGGSGMMMGIKGQDHSTPLVVESVGKGDLEWLAVKDRWYMTAGGEWIREPGPMNGYPLYYDLVDVVGGQTLTRVHWTRVIRFGGDPLPRNAWLTNLRWDSSVLEAPHDAIKRYDALCGGIGSLIWDAKTDVFSVDGLRDYLATDEGEANLRKRFDAVNLAKSLFNILLIDGGKAGVGGDKYDQKEIHFAGLKDIISEFRNEVCGASHTPMAILFGQSQTGMSKAGEGDLDIYDDRIKGMQQSRLGPQLSRLFQVLVRSALGSMPEQFNFTFNPLRQVNQKEKAEIEKMRAEADQIHWNLGTIAGSTITKKLRDNRTYPLTDKDVALVEQAESTPEPHNPTTEGPAGDPADPASSASPATDAATRRVLRAVARDASQLQAFVFTKKDFTPEKAAAWLKRNGKSVTGPDEDNDSLRYRQEDPEAFTPGSFRTIAIAPGVSAVIGHPKVKNDGTDVVSRKEFQGFKIAVENPAGTLRHWKDADGNDRGTTSMRNDYGFFEDHLGADGEELDAYLGPDEKAKDVHVVRQMKRPDYEKFDENKVVLGARSAEHAKEIYLSHRDDGDSAFGGMTTLPMAIFKKKLNTRTGLGPIRA